MKPLIRIAENASFCPGVERAIGMCEKALVGSKRIVYSAGPLIHNPEVVRGLSMLGLKVFDPTAEPLPEDISGSTIIIRSHGIDLETEKRLRLSGARIIDATCQNVRKAQKEASNLVRNGFKVVVIGSRDHPEVISIVGRAGEGISVIENVEEAERWISSLDKSKEKVGLICQTTIPRSLLESVKRLFEKSGVVFEVRDTICQSVVKRQREALRLSRDVDLMVVVGGRNSSNTTRLASMCRDAGTQVIQVEDAKEITRDSLSGVKRIGIIGGASTPSWQIDETAERIRELAPDC